MKYIYPLFFAIVFFFAVFIRTTGLDKYPEGVLADEASFAYNAYSIEKTGKDEWGKPYPLLFKAFGDQKLPAYVYTIVPCIKLFGMNNIALRFPSAIAGSLFCVVIAFLVYRLTKNKTLCMITMLIASFSPWTITISRFGYESNLALFFFTCGLLFEIMLVQEQKKKYALLAGICFGLTWYTYIAYRLSSALFILILSTYFVFQKKVNRKNVALGIFAFVLTISPIFSQLFSKAGNARFTQIGIIADKGPMQAILEKRTFCSRRFPIPICYLSFNKGTIYGELFVKRMIRVYGVEFLFFEGDSELAYLQVANFGQFYIFLIPLYFLGIYSLFLKKNRFLFTFLLIGLFCTTVPIILTGNPQKIRASGTLPFFLILFSYGYQTMCCLFQKKYRFIIFVVFLVLHIYSTVFFILSAFIHLDRYDSSFNTHIFYLMRYLSEKGDRKIYINPSFSDPIMMYAYHMKIDPSQYQSEVVFSPVEESGFQHAEKLGSLIEVTDDYCIEDTSAILVSNVLRQSKCLKLEKQIYSTNGVHSLLNVYSFIPKAEQIP